MNTLNALRPPNAPESLPAQSTWRLWLAAFGSACLFVAVGYLAALFRGQLDEDGGHGKLLPQPSVESPPAAALREPVTTQPLAVAVQSQVDRRPAKLAPPAVSAPRRIPAAEPADSRARHTPKSELSTPPAPTVSQGDLMVASGVGAAPGGQRDGVPASHSDTANADRPQVSLAAAMHVEPNQAAPVLRIVPLDANSPEPDDAPPGDSLTREEVQRGIELQRGQLVACAGDHHGTSQAQLTISPEGRVTYSLVEGAFAGTPEGSCMARALRAARFPRFASEAFTVRYPFRL